MSALCLYAEQYHIRSVAYDIQGITRQYPLSKVVNIDTAKVFTSRPELDSYLNDKLIQLKNQRVLEEVFIIPSYGSENDEGIIPVDLIIKTKDTWNIIALPYPKYDSNSGFIFKLKIKDYNFFGSMRTLSGDISYEYEEGKSQPHNLGASVSFDIPFKAGVFDADWTNNLSTGYRIGNSAVHAELKTGLDFSLPFHQNVSFNFGILQGIAYAPDYKEAGDGFYLSETAYIELPIILVKTEKFGDIVWKPTASIKWNWDPTQISAKNDGIVHKDLKGPDIKLEHGIAAGRINWQGNYRHGYMINFSQALFYDTCYRTYGIRYSLSGEYYRAFKYTGLASRFYVFKTFGEVSKEGDRIRGVRDAHLKTDSALLINIDIPIKVWQTNWRALGWPDWTKWLDFEMQVSPFFDIALANNSSAGTYYNIKDGWYAAGLEIIGFPNKMRSIQGRISFGVDGVLLAKQMGKNSAFIDKVVNKLFHTSWRTGSWYELLIGIGLHY